MCTTRICLIKRPGLQHNLVVKVLATRPIPQKGVDALRNAGFDVVIRDKAEPPDSPELQALARQFPVIITLLTDPVNEDVLSAGVRLIAQMAVGYDNIDLSAAVKHGVLITNTPGVLTPATAELTWALILAVSRHIIRAHEFTVAGRFKAWDPVGFLGLELRSSTLGVIGAGRIGSAVANIGLAFGMRVLYFNRSPRPQLDEAGAVKADLDTLLESSHVVSLHLPLTPETRGILSEERLRKMRSDAILVNTARGALVDEASLVKLLKEKRIAGAGLDVYQNEPELHPGLKELDNVVLLPHIGSATSRARQAMSMAVAENIIAFAQGRIPPNALNPEVLKK